MPAQPFIPFPAFRPDLTDLGTDSSVLISGVLPRGDGYGPFKSYAAFTSALPDNCRGFFFARRSDGSIAVFAGTSTRLYILDNVTLTWTDASKGGSAYGALVTDKNWKFAQFNEFVIATQVNTVPQKYVLNSATAFVDLGGSPPQAGQVAIVNRFVMLTELLSNPRRAQWSDLDAPETWTAGVGLSDFQDFPDGGICHAISGGDAYGVIFQDEAIRSLTYAPGSAAIFQIVRISTQDTLFAEYSVVNAGTRTFFLSAQGFKVIVAGGEPTAIGKEQVDAFFFGDVDTNNLQLVIGVADPSGTRVGWAYKSQAGDVGLFDKILWFDWSIKDRPWSIVPMSGQYIGYLARPGLTLEGLDVIAPGTLAISNVTNVGGFCGLTVASIARVSGPAPADGAPTETQLQVGDKIAVGGVTGTGGLPAAINVGNITISAITGSGPYVITTNVAFVGAYTSGGTVAGSLDALTFSLDSISVAAAASLAQVGPDGMLGFFTGPNIEAILETAEQDADDFVFLDGITPYTDASAALGSIGYRNQAQAEITYTGESAVNSRGDCPVNLEAQYMKCRIRIPAGSTWKYARGIKPNVQAAGDT